MTQSERERDFAEKFSKRFAGRFEYIGGFINSKMPVAIRCVVCGYEFWHGAYIIRRDEKDIICHQCREMRISERKTPKDYKRICYFCGKIFESFQKSAKYCSDECRRNGTNKRLRDEYQAQRIPVIVACRYCGKEFDSRRGARYCSTPCRQLAEKNVENIHNRRRVLKTTIKLTRGIRINPISIKRIWIRDGGKCKICGKPVDINLSRGGYGKKMDMMCATVDHIVPLACGGEHTMENVRLAHLICNSKRGTGGNAQLLLFG